MKKLVLLRHGQSAWNLENRFTGWEDVGLTERGVEEARQAGITLKKEGIDVSIAFTSYLKRAIKTLWLALEEMDRMYIPVYKNWRLNEKHYGALQGLNKTETAQKYGEEQVKLWRRGFAIAPPVMEKSDPRHPLNDPRYQHEEPEFIPSAESLADTIQRMMPYWESAIKPAFASHDTVLVAAHGNSLRGLVMKLKGLTEEQVLELNIPTGIPYIFELNDSLGLVKDYYLADEATLAALMEEVANQGKAK